MNHSREQQLSDLAIQFGHDTPLRAVAEWQRSILESAGHAIIATDPDGLILHFNPAAETLLGYSAEEMIGIHTPALIHDSHEVIERAVTLSQELGTTITPGFEVFVAKARQGIREEREWTYLCKDGRRIPVLLSVTALRNDQGELIGFLGVAVDLTLRKALESTMALAQAHELSANIIRAVAHGILCLSPESPYVIRFANPFAAGLLGIPESSLVGLALDEAVHIDASSIQGPDGRLEKLKPHDSTAFEADVVSPAFPKGFAAAITLARTDEGPDGMLVLTIQDITQRRLTEQSLRLSSKAFEVCSESIMVTDTTGIILSVNPAFTWLTGYRPDEVLGKTPRLLKSGRHDDAFYQKMWQQLFATGQWQGEVWDKRKDGTLFPKWVNIDAVRENGEITHFVSVAHDISAHKEHEDRIRHLAEHDALTGLPNRRVLIDRANGLIESSRQSDRYFAVVLIDLDRFKNINDTLGHLVGDKVLVEVARRLVQGTRTTDTVVRLGGDEFVILLTGIQEARTISEVVTNIHRRLGEAMRIEGRVLHAPPSMGIACYPDDGTDIDTLLRNADAAMYQTKARGRNGWTFYTQEMNVQITERLALEEALHNALDNNELELHFQPVISSNPATNSQRILSWEALLRWQHPSLGNIEPERIIPIAEETGLIHTLGKWTFQRVCQTLANWREQGNPDYRISVNISPTQLEQTGFSRMVLDTLKAYDVPTAQLELEMTEHVLMSHSPVVMESLHQLRAAGILLTLDDFGTGYSSLTYLKTLAVDRVKIDRSFVSSVLADHSDASIVQAVIMLANNLKLGVVAEGVETLEQQQFLEKNGCAEMQGFLLGRPMPAEEVAGYIQLMHTSNTP